MHGKRCWAKWARIIPPDTLLPVAEMVDELVLLRARVIERGAHADRAALRKLEETLTDRLAEFQQQAYWAEYRGGQE